MQHGRPGRFDRGGKRYEHVLDGDGHLIKFVVDGKRQRAHISNAYVKTDEFLQEEAADDILFRSTFGTQPRGRVHNFMNLHLKNQANTNIQFCGGSLVALWEAGLPWRVDPWTLETLGVATMDASVRGQPGALTVTTGLLRLVRALVRALPWLCLVRALPSPSSPPPYTQTRTHARSHTHTHTHMCVCVCVCERRHRELYS